MDSRIPKFYEKSLEERLATIKEFASLNEEEVGFLKKCGALDFETADRMIENVYSTFQLPLGVATNFIINGTPRLVPFALEEPSVVAAASNAAKLSSGFEARASEPVMIGQVQITNCKNPKEAIEEILAKEKELIEKANGADSTLVKFGGGARKIEAREIKTARGSMVVLHLLVDVRDAMGANAINTMCERISKDIEKLSKGKVRLKIISNLAVHRTVKAKTVWTKEVLGEETIENVLDAYEFAANDVYRAATHNKGIMNGIDAVVIATGNDFRAVEAGAHAFASISGTYKPLTKYYKNRDGNLVGEIELPVAVGTVGGATRTHPLAQINLKILGVKKASELAEIIASVGLAQNFAAMKALATEGIQRGHMKLHAKNIAITAGAKGAEIDEIAKRMAEEKNISVGRAKEILEAKK